MELPQIARTISSTIKGQVVLREMLTEIMVAKTPANRSVLTLRQREALELSRKA